MKLKERPHLDAVAKRFRATLTSGGIRPRSIGVGQTRLQAHILKIAVDETSRKGISRTDVIDLLDRRG